VIAMARLTFADMAADSGVLLAIVRVRSSFAIRRFPSSAGAACGPASPVTPGRLCANFQKAQFCSRVSVVWGLA
jgi:hypothetical protein